MIKFIEVKISDIPKLAKLTNYIWHEYWTCILTNEQIDYMVEKFQSEKAILNQYKHEKYSYYFINENGKDIGYFGLSDKKDYLFLSKLYISKEYRHKGIGTKSFEKIKEIAKAKGYKAIRLTVNKHNTNTINAYNQWGFKTIDAVVTDIGNGFVMDDYIMEYKT